jgi:uncharacterized protein YbjT (DUF2867 family)
MIALIAGSTGLVGSFLLKQLSESEQYTEIISLVRKSTNIQITKVTERVVDFDRLVEIKNLPDKVDTVFCCLGTTMKQAGSKSEFYKVDYEYVLNLAELAQKHQADTFVLNSALGADKNSAFFYNRVKGKIEEALHNLNFPNLIIVRPSLLLGKRNDERFGEKLGGLFFKCFGILFFGPLKKYKAVRGEAVAARMLKSSFKNGKHVIESDRI